MNPNQALDRNSQSIPAVCPGTAVSIDSDTDYSDPVLLRLYAADEVTVRVYKTGTTAGLVGWTMPAGHIEYIYVPGGYTLSPSGAVEAAECI